jgi:hypothetical protein
MDANRKSLARELVDDVEQHYLRCQLQRGPKSALRTWLDPRDVDFRGDAERHRYGRPLQGWDWTMRDLQLAFLRVDPLNHAFTGRLVGGFGDKALLLCLDCAALAPAKRDSDRRCGDGGDEFAASTRKGMAKRKSTLRFLLFHRLSFIDCAFRGAGWTFGVSFPSAANRLP